MRLLSGNGNKETGNDHILPVFRMLWNCREDSREFNKFGDGYKNWSHPRGRREHVLAGGVEEFLAEKSESGFFLNEKRGRIQETSHERPCTSSSRNIKL